MPDPACYIILTSSITCASWCDSGIIVMVVTNYFLIGLAARSPGRIPCLPGTVILAKIPKIIKSKYKDYIDLREGGISFVRIIEDRHIISKYRI